MSDMWVEPENDPRQGTDPTDERTNLLDYLTVYRQTFEMKCDGLDVEQMARRSVPPSTMSMLGLLRHLADVEISWFRNALSDDPTPRHYRTAEDRDQDFNGAVADEAVVEEAWRTWRAEVTNSEHVATGLRDMAAMARHRDEEISVRDILLHMVEEYARHVGHADLLRECIDGRTGQ